MSRSAVSSAAQSIYRFDDVAERRILDGLDSGLTPSDLARRHRCPLADIRIAVARAEARRDDKPVPPLPKRIGRANQRTKRKVRTDEFWQEVDRLRCQQTPWYTVGKVLKCCTHTLPVKYAEWKERRALAAEESVQ